MSATRPGPKDHLKQRLTLSITLVLSFLIAGCSSPDSRLVSDEQTCVNMGHLQTSPTYEKCLSELNARRCDYRAKHGHVATRACTKL